MKKTFKRLIAIVMATTTMAVGFGGMSVSAVSETASWSARYVNVHGAPTTESRTGYAIMQASSEVYTGKVNTMSDITNRSLTLSSTSHVMTTGSIVYIIIPVQEDGILGEKLKKLHIKWKPILR